VNDLSDTGFGTGHAIAVSGYQDTQANDISGNTITDANSGVFINAAFGGGPITDVQDNTFVGVVNDITVTSPGSDVQFDTGGAMPNISTLDPLTVIAGSGDDTITGSTAIESLIGGAGADTLIGGAGADTITGGFGDDIMHGGDVDVADGAADTFVFANDATSTGDDIVFNFEFGILGGDVLDLSGYAVFTSFTDVLNASTDRPGVDPNNEGGIDSDLFIDLGNGSSIVLVDVEKTDLNLVDVLL